MNIDEFGEFIDKFLKKNEIKMLITFPEKSREADIQVNVPPSPVFHFYIMLHAMKKIFEDMLKLEVLDENKKEPMLDAMLDLLKKGILEDENQDSKEEVCEKE